MSHLRSDNMENQATRTCSSRLWVMLAFILSGLLSGLVCSPAVAATIQFFESQITSNPAFQENPAVYGDTVVYQDNRNGNWDIYMVKYGYAETRITTDTADQINPRIYGNKIVYQDNRNGNWDIYLYDLTTHTETQITNNPLAQEYPAIYGNRIVWQDSRNTDWENSQVIWDIYMYDLSTDTETRVTTSGVNNIHPSISGNRIAFMRDRDVYYVDLSTGSEVRITAIGNTTGQTAGPPAMDVNQIVWPQHLYSFGGWRYIALKDVASGYTWNTETAGVTEDLNYPDISELQPGIYYVVYQDDISGDLRLFVSGLGTRYWLTTAIGVQKNAKVSGPYVVYQDDRNGNWDIYMTMIGYGPGAPHPPTPTGAMNNVEIVKRLVADPGQIPTSDMDGPNVKAKENRRKALVKKLETVIAAIQAAADSTDQAGSIKNYQEAIDQLNSILDKTDGCALRGKPDKAGSGFTPDWIIACESQAKIEPLIAHSVMILQAVLELVKAE